MTRKKLLTVDFYLACMGLSLLIVCFVKSRQTAMSYSPHFAGRQLMRMQRMVFFVVIWLALAGCAGRGPTSTPTAEPLIPSPTPLVMAQPSRGAVVLATAVPHMTQPPAPTAVPPTTVPPTAVPPTAVPPTAVPPTAVPPTTVPPTVAPIAAVTPLPRTASGFWGAGQRARVGVGMPVGNFTDFAWRQPLPGWYLAWSVVPKPVQPPGVRFAQMVRLNGDSYQPDVDTIRAAAVANRGALWLIGNEPDVKWQDNITAEQYVASYEILYRTIKAADPTAQVAIGGVSVPTPLRMAYLDRILALYRGRFGVEIPVDVWNVHAFILREERDSWGVDIPPGMAENQGLLYEIKDHADMAIFKRQIADFRRWMAQRGLRDKPLIVSEYGVLMPDSYGFPFEVTGRFMVDTFNYFLTARDPQTGFPADDNRLVQAFCWYSVADTVYPTSNLFDPNTMKITPLGDMFSAYMTGLGE